MSEEIIICQNCKNDLLFAYNQGDKSHVGINFQKALEKAKNGFGKNFFWKVIKYIPLIVIQNIKFFKLLEKML